MTGDSKGVLMARRAGTGIYTMATMLIPREARLRYEEEEESA